ncbi:MAG: MEDS domain-containing protein, partial [bacterium]
MKDRIMEDHDPIIMRPFLDLSEARQIKWGSHIALFFGNDQEQREISFPFIKNGLLAHEKCLWIRRRPDDHNVLNHLKSIFSEMEREDYLITGQLEILDQEAWFPGKDPFDINTILRQYREKYDEALRRRYEGLRLVLDVPLITEIHWELYMRLERVMDKSIRDDRTLLICNYDLTKYTTRQIITITSLHQYTLIKNRNWFLAESAETVRLQDLAGMETRLRPNESREPRGTQEKIAEERRRLEDIVLSIGAGLLIMDKKMKIVWMNPVAEQWFGPLSKLEGTYCYESLKGKEEMCPGCSVLMVFQNGKNEVTEEYHDQIGRLLRCVATPIKNDKGEVIQVLKLTYDVTREKKTLQALRKAEEKYRTLTENMPEMVYTADPKKDFAVSYVSKSVTSIYGYERTEKQLRKPGFWAEAIYPEDKEYVLSQMHQAYREGRESTLEYRIVDKSGKVKWIQNRLHWIKDQEGRILYLQGLIQNINQQKVNESRLKLFTSVLDGINDSVFLVNSKTGLIEYANEAACRLHGYDQKELIGKSPRVFGHPENPPGLNERIFEATARGGWEGSLKNS